MEATANKRNEEIKKEERIEGMANVGMPKMIMEKDNPRQKEKRKTNSKIESEDGEGLMHVTDWKKSKGYDEMKLYSQQKYFFRVSKLVGVNNTS
ncbi:hypothetical protein NQ315_008039 [Exocentrus adspersus]|uniref:Uncharacterized protein n=1 Tax=Exocentrus adspersus TaxID=1586481 RepID=A0AAV8VVD3_9CUCU|nr:hypothetical protein NQ315_008039 [Exocentrus adspersus]